MSFCITRRSWLTGLAGTAAAQPARRPNIVIIVADDLGIGDVGCYGAADMKTPHLDRLAAEGIRFTDWHANSPVCSPSRASLLTGQYPQRCGIPQILFSRPGFDVPGLRKGEITLASLLKKQGYRTAAVGKWHLGSAPESRPLAQGFDSFFGFFSGWIDYYSHRFYTLGGVPVYHDLWRNDREVWSEPEYQTEMLARESSAFISRQSRQQPFFLYLAFGAPHYPMMAPQKYIDRFPESMDRDRRMHAAMVAALDDAVGVVRAAIRKSGLDRDTCIFFMSDNGATHEERADHRGRPYEGGSNHPYRGWKGSLLEGGMRVPAMMAWRGHLRLHVNAGAAAAMDVLPTLLEMAGTKTGPHADGVDLSIALAAGQTAPERTLYWDYDGQLAAREGKWKYLSGVREGLGLQLKPGPLLFDLAADPGEKQNLAESVPDVVARLAKKAAQWQRSLASSSGK